MESVLSIPYFAPNPSVPLPTDAEIDAGSDISLAYGGRRVVEVGSHFVVKFGEGVDLMEGENMIFVQEKTAMPLPRVYALYSRASKNYIVMERIAGQTLSSLWSQLHASEKESIVEMLRSYFSELRNLPPPTYYGCLGRRRLLDGIFWTVALEEPAINGPFDSEAAFIEALPLKYTYDGRSGYRADYYRQTLPQRLEGDSQHPQLSTWRIHIIDWEKSGWYPTYWDHAMASCALRWDDDWCLWVQKALDPYPSEAAWLQIIRPELWS
ncbi:unnamed protein product [Zymoseptoria tritici ST99CH_1E4]|uniref:Aminoglycoside phosphotransferase domain-containing protein n=1 Tax=Zymoseptoria tritici ST99CH_1E4 TaxID=1276532 RepID=A0A2H1G6P0_ZYMTR|nr:unnamed protein product [Zymoseptoria tritici ST99CH_1E4]